MTENLSLHSFEALDDVKALETYIDALTAFDSIEQLQELKRIERGLVKPSSSILDVGCGFGLETERLARLVLPGKPVAGIDLSARFIAEAKRRAAADKLRIDYRVGDADALPYADRSYSHVRAERLLIYLADPAKAVSEMKRVLAPGGLVALIEPDFTTNDVNLENRPLVRRVMAHEADTAVKQSWLAGRLTSILTGAGLGDIAVYTRVLIFPQDLAAEYYASTGTNAAKAGAISAAENDEWQAGIARLHSAKLLFGTIGYFLFTARG